VVQFTSKKLGSQSAPLKWSNPNYRVANVYRDEDGKWMYQTANKEWIAASLLPSDWQEKLKKSLTPKEEQEEEQKQHEEEKSGSEEIGVVSQEKKQLAGPELKKYLNEPANHKTAPYGYIRQTEGTDGDAVDCFLGSVLDAPWVYVIHSRNKWGEYDEDKVMLGFDSEDAARECFLENYDHPEFLGNIEKFTMTDFKYKLKALKGKKITGA